MALAAEAELAALFIAAQEMLPHQQTLIDMGWPKPCSLAQTNNSTAKGYKQDHHSQKDQHDGHETVVAAMLRLPKTVLLLLGCRI